MYVFIKVSKNLLAKQQGCMYLGEGLVHLCRRVSPGDENANTNLESVAPKSTLAVGKSIKKSEIYLHGEGCRADRPASPHLSPPLGFWFNTDGTFPVFIGKHQNTRSMGLRIPARHVQDVWIPHLLQLARSQANCTLQSTQAVRVC